MKKVTCVNGHFYDADRFDSCPICGQVGSEPERHNETPFESEATVPLSRSLHNDELSSTTWLSPEEMIKLWGDDAPVEELSAQEPTPPEELQELAAPGHQVDELAPTMWITPNVNSLAESEELSAPPAPQGNDAMPLEETEVPGPEKAEAPGTDEVSEVGEDERSSPVNGQSAELDRSASNAQPYGSLAQAVAASDAVGISPVPETVRQEADKPAPLPVGWLVGLSASSRGKVFPCRSGRNRIGRAPQMEISLPWESSVAPVSHAQVIYEPKKRQFFLQAGNEDGLTYLNDELVFTHEELHAYDRIALGEAEFVFLPLCGEKFDWDMNTRGE